MHIALKAMFYLININLINVILPLLPSIPDVNTTAHISVMMFNKENGDIFENLSVRQMTVTVNLKERQFHF
jgi:hypothetical protein